MIEIQTWERVIPVEDREYQITEKYNLDLLERVKKAKRMKERLDSMSYEVQWKNLKFRLFKEIR